MQGVILITTPEQWQQLRLHQSPLATRSYDVGPNRHVIEFSEGYVAYNKDNDLAREYEPEELALLPPGERLFVLVEYTSPRLLRQVVLEAPLGDESWIDDDNNGPVPLRDFRGHLHDDPDWDWRQ